MTDKEYALEVATTLINIGADCQKAKSFIVAISGVPARSVYEASGEALLASLISRFRSTA